MEVWMPAYLSGAELTSVAATLTAALFEKLGHPIGQETPENIAKLFFEVRGELEKMAPKPKMTVQKLAL